MGHWKNKKVINKLTAKNKYWRYILWYKKDMRKFVNLIKQYKKNPDPNSLSVCVKDKDFGTLLFANPDLFFAELDLKYASKYYRQYIKRGNT